MTSTLKFPLCARIHTRSLSRVPALTTESEPGLGHEVEMRSSRTPAGLIQHAGIKCFGPDVSASDIIRQAGAEGIRVRADL